MKDKNCIFTCYQIFVNGKILVFHRCLYNKYSLYFRFKSLHPTTHHDFLFEMRCLNSRVKLPQQTICFLYPFHVVLMQLASINYGVFSDVDECQDGTHNCDSNALCNNSAGSFTCACFQGYSGSGVVCSGKLRHQQIPNDHVFIILAL